MHFKKMRTRKNFERVAPLVCSIGMLVACQQTTPEIVNTIRNTRITIPQDKMLCLLPEKKALLKDSSTNMKYIVYYDSTICSACQLKKISIWNKIVTQSYSLGADLELIFIFSPKVEDKQLFIDSYYSNKIMHKLYIDSLGMYEKINPILQDSRQFHSIVINNKGRIIFVGNPADNVSTERLFYNFLQDKNYLNKMTSPTLKE